MSTLIPSPVAGSGSPDLGLLFPTIVPEPEKLVYQYLLEACGGASAQEGTMPPEGIIPFPEDQGTPVILPARFSAPPLSIPGPDGPRALPLVRGWPTYPGKVPALGVAIGTETEDDQDEGISGGFIGDTYAKNKAGETIATASYYAQRVYATIIVELISENRDQRDEFHTRIRTVLAPLKRRLPSLDKRIFRASVDSEKQEVEGGPPESEQPFVIYCSVFTVHCWYEMWEAQNVTGADGVFGNEPLNIEVEPQT